ncbi:MAG: molybdopterin-dependent oxidoreductase, partial [Pseudonocardiaceae bacterium]
MSAPVAVLIGLLSVAAGLGVGHLVAGLVSPSASPFLAVGGSAIDLTPSWLKDFAVSTFGTYDKLVLLLSMGVVIGLVAVLAGLLSRRSAAPGLVLLIVLGGVAGVAVLARPNADALDTLAPLAALIVGVGVFVALYRLGGSGGAATKDAAAEGAGAEGAAGDRAPSAVRRRGLLIGSAAVAVGAGIAAAGGQLLAGRGGVEASRAALGRIVPTVAAPPIPAGADFTADGSPTFITPNRDFYRVDINLTLPRLRAEDWRLRVHG